MVDDWRKNPLVVFCDDNGVPLKASDFGLKPGDKIRASYVREHPEMPWPQWILKQAGEM